MKQPSLVPEDLWEAIAPLLPEEPPKPMGCRRLGIRYERRADLVQGFLHLACALICLQFLDPAKG